MSENVLRKILKKTLNEFPVLVVEDPYALLDEAYFKDLGIHLLIYRGKEDYPLIRGEIEKIKAFDVSEPTVFLFRPQIVSEFADFRYWAKILVISPSAITSDVLGIDIPDISDPLLSDVFKLGLIEKFEHMWSKWKKFVEFPLSASLLEHMVLSLVFDEDILTPHLAEDEPKKVLRAFETLANSKRYPSIQNTLLKSEQVRDSVDNWFSNYMWLKNSLINATFRDQFLTLLLAYHSVSKLEGLDRRNKWALLCEGLHATEELRREVPKAYTLTGNVERFIENNKEDYQKFLGRINGVIGRNEKVWFKEIENTSDLQLFFKACSGILSSEFDFVLKKIKWFIETEKIISKSNVEDLKSVLSDLNSWLIVRVEDRYQEIRDLNMLISLSTITSDLLDAAPSSWNEWTDIYEKSLLEGDKLSWELRELPESEIAPYQKVLSKYSEARLRTIHNYEAFLFQNYPKWVTENLHRPMMVSDVLRKIMTLIKDYDVVFLVIYDGMRIDFWNVLKHKLTQKFHLIGDDQRILSIVPSVTIYSRKAIFSGLFPEDLFSFSETRLLEKKIGKIFKAKRGGRIEVFRELLDERGKLRVFVYELLDEISHFIDEGIPIALKSFEKIAEKHVKFLERIKKLGRVLLVITSDHGGIGISGQKTIELPDRSKWWFKFRPHSRYAIFAKEKRKSADPYDIHVLIENLKDQDLKYIMTDVKKAKLTKMQNWSRGFREIVEPYFIVFADGETFFVRPPEEKLHVRKKRPMNFIHGSLTPYETIVPFAILEPK